MWQNLSTPLRDGVCYLMEGTMQYIWNGWALLCASRGVPVEIIELSSTTFVSDEMSRSLRSAAVEEQTKITRDSVISRRVSDNLFAKPFVPRT